MNDHSQVDYEMAAFTLGRVDNSSYICMGVYREDLLL